MPSPNHRHAGLSLVEVFAITAVCVLLVVIVMPMLRRAKGGSRISCVSHLKQIGLAYRLYSNDHEEKFPFAVSNKQGGSLEFVGTPEVFRHFEAMSNELVTPKILVCPVDFANRNRQRAMDFQTGIANSNVSFFVGVDADESKPNRILSGDRNISGGALLRNGSLRALSPRSPADWTDKIHRSGEVNLGNIGLSDGSVQQVTATGLQKQLQAQDLAVIRLAIP